MAITANTQQQYPVDHPGPERSMPTGHEELRVYCVNQIARIQSAVYPSSRGDNLGRCNSASILDLPALDPRSSIRVGTVLHSMEAVALEVGGWMLAGCLN